MYMCMRSPTFSLSLTLSLCLSFSEFYQGTFLHFTAADAIRNDKIVQLLEERQKQDVFELSRALNEFRMLHQQPDSRREFDLYDPDYLKKDKPARVSDDDPRCGISGLQKFEGKN